VFELSIVLIFELKTMNVRLLVACSLLEFNGKFVIVLGEGLNIFSILTILIPKSS
jgi:hypothetical protein